MEIGSNANRIKLFRIVTNVLIVLMVFLMPDVLFDVHNDFATRGMHYVRPITLIVVFYLNFLFIIPNMLFRRHNIWLFFIYNLILSVVASIILICAHHIDFGENTMLPPGLFGPPVPIPRQETWTMMIVGFFSHDFVFLVFTIGLSVAFRLTERWSKWEKEQAAIEAERKDRELANLKSQLNPHFLFNTLNNIYALISIDQGKAQRAVHELSQLLRYMLYENKEKTIPLECELRFITNYIELMKLRLTSNTELKVNVNENDGVGLQIAPFMFISIVENAFKHGVNADKPSFVHISITVNGNTVRCVTKNSVFMSSERSERYGIGIENLKRQVAILYPNKHLFEIEKDSSSYTTILEINL